MIVDQVTGEIFLFGERQEASGRERVRGIGYLPGEFGLYPDLTGRAHLHHVMKLRGIDPDAACARNEQRLFERFPLSLDRKVRGYSKGMKQLLGIMQAFMHEPPLLILDEPTSGLDPLMREAFFALLREERAAGRTVFLSSHNLAEVDRICDRVGIIKAGRLSMVEPIERQRSAVGKKIRVVPAHLPDACAEALGRLAGVEHLRWSSDGVEFLYKGDMQELVANLAKMEIHDLSSESPSLDDFFLQYYGD